MPRAISAARETYSELVNYAVDFCLCVKVNKVKMLGQIRDNRIRQSIITGENNTEIVKRFTCLGVELTKDEREGSVCKKE